MTEIAPSELVSITEVAQITGLPRSTVRVYRSRGTLPEPIAELGSGPVWRREDIENWNAERLARKETR